MLRSLADIILETGNMYTLNTRALFNGKCKYLTLQGRKCAIGMRMTREALVVHQTSECGVDGIYNLIDCLLPEYRIENHGFWRAIQCFHDSRSYWDDTGLSAYGWDHLNVLLNHYAPDYGR